MTFQKNAENVFDVKIDVAQEVAAILKELMDLVSAKKFFAYTLLDNKYSPNEGNVAFVRKFTVQIEIFKTTLGCSYTSLATIKENLKNVDVETQEKLINIHKRLFLINNVYFEQVPIPEGYVFSHTYFYSHEMNNSLEGWTKDETEKWKKLPEFVKGLVDFPKMING